MAEHKTVNEVSSFNHYGDENNEGQNHNFEMKKSPFFLHVLTVLFVTNRMHLM